MTNNNRKIRGLHDKQTDTTASCSSLSTSSESSASGASTPRHTTDPAVLRVSSPGEGTESGINALGTGNGLDINVEELNSMGQGELIDMLTEVVGPI